MAPLSTPLIKQGWLRAVIYLIVIFVGMAAFQTLAMFFIDYFFTTTSPTELTNFTGFAINYLFVAVVIFLITFFFRRYFDRQTFYSLGFHWQGYRNEALLGFFTGPALLGIGTIILVLAGYLTLIDASFNSTIFVLQLVMLIIVSITEEVLFRGYLLHNFMQSMNKWIALLTTALLFAVFHASNPGITIAAAVNIFMAGILLGVNYIHTRNLWFGIMFHFSWNFFQGPVLGYHVSGLQLPGIIELSTFGPPLFTGEPFGFEGSIVCTIVTLLAILWFVVVFRKKYKPIASTA